MQMKSRIEPDSLIFDMDGTLWDGVETYAKGFNDFFTLTNSPRSFTKNDLAGYMGWEEAAFLGAAFPGLGATERKAAYEQVIDFQYKRIESEGGYLYEGVREGLEALSKKYKLFIVSNCPKFTIDYFMRWAGITAFITDTMAHGKNYRHKHENIRLLIEKHALQNPVYVGDTESDGRQSRLVPLPFVFVSYGFGQAKEFDLQFHSFPDLARYFLGN